MQRLRAKWCLEFLSLVSFSIVIIIKPSFFVVDEKCSFLSVYTFSLKYCFLFKNLMFADKGRFCSKDWHFHRVTEWT